MRNCPDLSHFHGEIKSIYNRFIDLFPIVIQEDGHDIQDVMIKKYTDLFTVVYDALPFLDQNFECLYDRDWGDFCSYFRFKCNEIMSYLSETIFGRFLHSPQYEVLPVLPRDIYYTYIKANDVFYRMRSFEEDMKNVHAENLFHIPNHMRRYIVPQRYSVPGYPSIYLGKSAYGCWEELSRPSVKKCMLSRIKYCSHTIMPLLDLRVPSYSTFLERFMDDPTHCLNSLPLIMACMVTTENSSKQVPYKPEYIIPHAVSSLILYRHSGPFQVNDDKSPMGVAYTSIYFKNTEHTFIDNTFDNYVIPAIDVTHFNYCSRLTKDFHISEPACLEFIQETKGTSLLDSVFSDESDVGKIYDMFTYIEECLKDSLLFPMKELEPGPMLFKKLYGDTIPPRDYWETKAQNDFIV